MRHIRSAVLGLAAGLLAGIASAELGDPPPAPEAASGAQPLGAARHERGAAPLGGAGWELQHVLRELNLSVDQKTQVTSLFANAKPQFAALRARARANRAAFATASPNDPGYPALVAAVKADTDAGIQLASDLKTQAYAILTPEQQAKIPGILAADQATWAERRAARQAERAALEAHPSAVR